MKLFFLSLASCCLLLATRSPSTYTLVEDQAQLEIKSPRLAQRQTAKLRLASGLNIFLISDPGACQSAAALAVQVGSWDDPPQYPGMAHFLEHMLFMGNEAYPSESEYMQYIIESGGKVNAYTTSDHTVYMFSVNHGRFRGAFDRFSHFFIDPLFRSSSIDRELQAVDQEHAKNIENDSWRQYMIFKETANQDHPCAKFTTGNADTLSGIPQEVMKQWYQENYGAEKMHLLVYSALPLDQLIELADQGFSPVAPSSKEGTRPCISMLSNAQKGSIFYIKPVKDIKLLTIFWELPKALAAENESMAGALLRYILENGGKNSLLGALKKAALAEGIKVLEERFSPLNKLLELEITLTDRGLSECHQVIECCFEALARLRKTGIPRYIFDEFQSISEHKYCYQGREDAFAFVCRRAGQMVDEDLETFPQKTVVPTRYAPEVYTLYIDHLRPENALFNVIADPNLTGVTPDKKEKWMGAEYAVETVDPKLMRKWSALSINPRIGLPLPNPYIPQSLELLHNTYREDQIIPELLVDTSGANVYFAGDSRYLVPKIAYQFRILSPQIDGTARATALVDLFCKSLSNALYPIMQAAEAAGSTVRFWPGSFSFELSINGYNEPSFRLVENIFRLLKKQIPTRVEFDRFKHSLSAQYDNAAKELPLLQSLEMAENALFNNAPTSWQKAQALRALTYDQFCTFAKTVWKKAYIKSLMYGNLTKAEAKSLSASLSAIFDAEPFLPQDHYNREILLLPKTTGPYLISTQTPMLGNSAVLVLQQGPYSFEKRASQEVLGAVIRNEFFEMLRTKQQIAYIAKAWEKEEEQQLLQMCAVQSASHTPFYIHARHEQFLEHFMNQYTTILPKERFENVRQMAIAKLEMPPENLSTSASRLFTLCFDYDGDFDRIGKRIRALKALTYEQTQRDAVGYLSRQNTRRLAILVEGVPLKDRQYRYELTSVEELKERGTFVTKHEPRIEEAKGQPL